MKANDIVIGAMFILLGLLTVFQARTFPSMAGQMVGPSTFPTLIGSGLSVGGAVLILKQLLAGERAPLVIANSGWFKTKRVLSFALLFVGSLVFAIWIEEIGFVIGGAILAIALLWLENYRKPLILGFAALFVVVVYYLLSQQLNVPLPTGLFI
ncbi:tripartite tricarboxylate transporter TctB family protein [Halomonas sp. HMF6819]|uniref:tripartite tricarboxylate transporter TctB family protein n=1 Tax=unclassified Halomonas TaxID=2609666 RepID=UPI002076703F|nr:MULTISPECIES: tripartite tricarboxylate transporter TctB family protein [unclassified Halomonas]